jgi:hypothetical protein
MDINISDESFLRNIGTYLPNFTVAATQANRDAVHEIETKRQVFNTACNL